MGGAARGDLTADDAAGDAPPGEGGVAPGVPGGRCVPQRAALALAVRLDPLAIMVSSVGPDGTSLTCAGAGRVARPPVHVHPTVVGARGTVRYSLECSTHGTTREDSSMVVTNRRSIRYVTTAPEPPTELVVLCDDQGHAVGEAPKSTVHGTATPLHRAFSVHVFDAAGRTLITRRALTKVAWPGVWSNSCCGHPAPGERDEDAVRRRVRQELGVEITDLRCVLPDFRYRAVDAGGVVEHEVCPVFVARLDAEAAGPAPEDGPSPVDPLVVHPDSDEVAETAWVDWADLVAVAAATPQLLSPWSVLQLARLGATHPLPSSPSETETETETQRETATATQADAHSGTRPVTIVPASEAPVSPASPAATLAAVDAVMADALDRLVRRWERHLPARCGSAQTGIDVPAWSRDLVGGGKRLRPLLCHWGFVATPTARREAPGAWPGRTCPSGDLVAAAAAIELLHTFALVHDDVMDASPLRRGAVTTHVRAAAIHRAAGRRGDSDDLGRDVAILVGDLLHAEADRLAAGLPTPMRAEWDDLVVELIAGQSADVLGAAWGRADVEHATLVGDLKSGAYTLTRPLRLGALAAGAGPATLAALGEFGLHAGRAFALRDDVLGVWGDPQVTGKPAGDDLRCAKPTVIAALARLHLRGDDAALLARVGTGDLSDAEVQQLQLALDRGGIRDLVEERITGHVTAARTALNSPDLTDAGRTGLSELVGRIAWRTT